MCYTVCNALPLIPNNCRESLYFQSNGRLFLGLNGLSVQWDILQNIGSLSLSQPTFYLFISCRKKDNNSNLILELLLAFTPGGLLQHGPVLWQLNIGWIQALRSVEEGLTGNKAPEVISDYSSWTLTPVATKTQWVQAETGGVKQSRSQPVT